MGWVDGSDQRRRARLLLGRPLGGEEPRGSGEPPPGPGIVPPDPASSGDQGAPTDEEIAEWRMIAGALFGASTELLAWWRGQSWAAKREDYETVVEPLAVVLHKHFGDSGGLGPEIALALALAGYAAPRIAEERRNGMAGPGARPRARRSASDPVRKGEPAAAVDDDRVERNGDAASSNGAVDHAHEFERDPSGQLGRAMRDGAADQPT